MKVFQHRIVFQRVFFYIKELQLSLMLAIYYLSKTLLLFSPSILNAQQDCIIFLSDLEKNTQSVWQKKSLFYHIRLKFFSEVSSETIVSWKKELLRIAFSNVQSFSLFLCIVITLSFSSILFLFFLHFL